MANIKYTMVGKGAQAGKAEKPAVTFEKPEANEGGGYKMATYAPNPYIAAEIYRAACGVHPETVEPEGGGIMTIVAECGLCHGAIFDSEQSVEATIGEKKLPCHDWHELPELEQQ